MNFLILPFFLFLIIGSLSLIFISDFQSISPQSDTNSSRLDNISIKITSPSEGKKVPIGDLTISGISSDTQAKKCVVFVDWNDLKPFQPVRAAGPGGIDDFSEWIFTYDSKYHEIIEGENELTSKITCLVDNKPLTKWNSLNVTGYNPDSRSLSISNQNTTSVKSTDERQVPLQTVMPGANPKTNAPNTIIEQNTTSIQLSNIVPVEKNTTSIKSTDQQVPLQPTMASTNSNTNATNMFIEQNTTSLQLSNATTTVEKNTTSLQLSNLTDSEIEMVVPNESLNENQINNTNTDSISEGGKSTINNFTTNEFSQSSGQNPRIDLDEQPPTALDEQQQEQQQQEQQRQQQQPPTALDEQQRQQQEQQEQQQEQQEQQRQQQRPPTALDE
ncbi:MAG: hypothetical protein K0S93_1239, partial [Nitrososphaeraceae archaeon]|nr:hypothetical protein [Nitrososphaeraceae archaeon]